MAITITQDSRLTAWLSMFLAGYPAATADLLKELKQGYQAGWAEARADLPTALADLDRFRQALAEQQAGYDAEGQGKQASLDGYGTAYCQGIQDFQKQAFADSRVAEEQNGASRPGDETLYQQDTALFSPDHFRPDDVAFEEGVIYSLDLDDESPDPAPDNKGQGLPVSDDDVGQDNCPAPDDDGQADERFISSVRQAVEASIQQDKEQEQEGQDKDLLFLIEEQADGQVLLKGTVQGQVLLEQMIAGDYPSWAGLLEKPMSARTADEMIDETLFALEVSLPDDDVDRVVKVVRFLDSNQSALPVADNQDSPDEGLDDDDVEYQAGYQLGLTQEARPADCSDRFRAGYIDGRSVADEMSDPDFPEPDRPDISVLIDKAVRSALKVDDVSLALADVGQDECPLHSDQDDEALMLYLERPDLEPKPSDPGRAWPGLSEEQALAFEDRQALLMEQAGQQWPTGQPVDADRQADSQARADAIWAETLQPDYQDSIISRMMPVDVGQDCQPAPAEGLDVLPAERYDDEGNTYSPCLCGCGLWNRTGTAGRQIETFRLTETGGFVRTPQFDPEGQQHPDDDVGQDCQPVIDQSVGDRLYQVVEGTDLGIVRDDVSGCWQLVISYKQHLTAARADNPVLTGLLDGNYLSEPDAEAGAVEAWQMLKALPDSPDRTDRTDSTDSTDGPDDLDEDIGQDECPAPAVLSEQAGLEPDDADYQKGYKAGQEQQALPEGCSTAFWQGWQDGRLIAQVRQEQGLPAEGQEQDNQEQDKDKGKDSRGSVEWSVRSHPCLCWFCNGEDNSPNPVSPAVRPVKGIQAGRGLLGQGQGLEGQARPAEGLTGNPALPVLPAFSLSADLTALLDRLTLTGLEDVGQDECPDKPDWTPADMEQVTKLTGPELTDLMTNQDSLNMAVQYVLDVVRAGRPVVIYQQAKHLLADSPDVKQIVRQFIQQKVQQIYLSGDVSLSDIDTCKWLSGLADNILDSADDVLTGRTRFPDISPEISTAVRQACLPEDVGQDLCPDNRAEANRTLGYWFEVSNRSTGRLIGTGKNYESLSDAEIGAGQATRYMDKGLIEIRFGRGKDYLPNHQDNDVGQDNSPNPDDEPADNTLDAIRQDLTNKKTTDLSDDIAVPTISLLSKIKIRFALKRNPDLFLQNTIQQTKQDIQTFRTKVKETVECNIKGLPVLERLVEVDDRNAIVPEEYYMLENQRIIARQSYLDYLKCCNLFAYVSGWYCHNHADLRQFVKDEDDRLFENPMMKQVLEVCEMLEQTEKETGALLKPITARWVKLDNAINTLPDVGQDDCPLPAVPDDISSLLVGQEVSDLLDQVALDRVISKAGKLADIRNNLQQQLAGLVEAGDISLEDANMLFPDNVGKLLSVTKIGFEEHQGLWSISLPADTLLMIDRLYDLDVKHLTDATLTIDNVPIRVLFQQVFDSRQQAEQVAFYLFACLVKTLVKVNMMLNLEGSVEDILKDIFNPNPDIDDVGQDESPLPKPKGISKYKNLVLINYGTFWVIRHKMKSDDIIAKADRIFPDLADHIRQAFNKHYDNYQQAKDAVDSFPDNFETMLKLLALPEEIKAATKLIKEASAMLNKPLWLDDEDLAALNGFIQEHGRALDLLEMCLVAVPDDIQDIGQDDCPNPIPTRLGKQDRQDLADMLFVSLFESPCLSHLPEHARDESYKTIQKVISLHSKFHQQSGKLSAWARLKFRILARADLMKDNLTDKLKGNTMTATDEGNLEGHDPFAYFDDPADTRTGNSPVGQDNNPYPFLADRYLKVVDKPTAELFATAWWHIMTEDPDIDIRLVSDVADNAGWADYPAKEAFYQCVDEVQASVKKFYESVDNLFGALDFLNLLPEYVETFEEVKQQFLGLLINRLETTFRKDKV